MTIRTLTSIEKGALIPTDKLKTVDNSIKPQLLNALDEITWFPYMGVEMCLANEIIEIRGASSTHFTKYRTRQLTDGQNVGGSELPGVFRLEGAEIINVLRKELALSITYVDNLIKPRTSTLYLLNFDAFYDYAVYGNDDYSKLWTNLSKGSIGFTAKEAVADEIAKNPAIKLEPSFNSSMPSALDIVEGMVITLRQQESQVNTNSSDIVLLKQDNASLQSKLTFLQGELCREKEASAKLQNQVDNIEENVNPIINRASFQSIADFCVENNFVATANAKRIIASAVAKECVESSIVFNRYPHTAAPNEYPKHIIKVITKKLATDKDSKVLHCKLDSNNRYQVWSSIDPNPFKAKVKRTNHYKGVLITRAQINSMIQHPGFIKAFNQINGTQHTKYKIWDIVIYPVVDEILAADAPTNCKKMKELTGASCLEFLETKCRLPEMYKWLLPYYQKAKELVSLKNNSPVDSKAHLARIKEAEAKRNSDK